MNKWIGISLGSILGLTHIAMIGMVANRNQLPQINLPVGDYTSYNVQAGKDGYSIEYKSNDPTVMTVEKDIKRKAGFLGLGNNTTKVTEQYTMGGSEHVEGTGGSATGDSEKKSVACIKAVGGGEQTGRLVGGSVGAAVAGSGLASVPYVGWVLAGAATMMGMEQGAEIGGQMVEDLNPDCDIEEAES